MLSTTKTVNISVIEYLSTLWAHERTVPNVNLLDVLGQVPLFSKYLEISWKLIVYYLEVLSSSKKVYRPKK